MSATGRKPGVRPAYDDFATPSWCLTRLLEAVPLPGGGWLEPCAGAGGIIKAVNARRNDVAWTAVEIQDKYEDALKALETDVEIGDFLERPSEANGYPAPFAVAITNPPYLLAEEVARKCQALAEITVLLLRVNFLAGAPVKHPERYTWLSAWTPDIYVLPNRPSFDGEGTDATEYCWMVWNRHRVNERGMVRLLGTTPKEERQRRPAPEQRA